jgi:hypothetical protein
MSQTWTKMEVIDFHWHHVPSRFELTAAKSLMASRTLWIRVRKLAY